MLHKMSPPVGRWNQGYTEHWRPPFFMAFVIDAIMNGIQNVSSVLYGVCARCHNECYTKMSPPVLSAFAIDAIMNVTK